MTRSLTTRQSELVADRSLRSIPLVTLTTYSDREAETVDTVYRFSDRQVMFDGEEWTPNLIGINPLVQTMSHIPDSTGADGAFDREASIVLRNSLLESGLYLSESLKTANILRARVEIAQLLLREGEDTLLDTVSISASEAITWFRGEVRQIERMTNGGDMELRLGSELVNVPYLTVGEGTTVPPRDRGKLIPIVYGSAVRNVPCIGVSVGSLSTLSAPVQYNATTFPLTDTTDFPTSGSGFVNGEYISWSGKSSTSLTSVTRGVSTTEAEPHSAGSIVVYTPSSIKYAVGQKGCTVSTFRVRNMLNNELTVFSATPSRNADDTSVFGTGNGITTYSFTGVQAALLAIVKSTMEVQPDFTFTGSGVDVEVIRPLGNHAISSVSTSDYMVALGINGSSPRIVRDFGLYSGGDNEGISFVYDASQADLNARIVNRYRLSLRGTLINVSGNGGAPPTVNTVVRVRSEQTDWLGAGGTLSTSQTFNFTADAPGTEYDVELLTSWVTPPASTDLSDFQGKSFEVEVENDGSNLTFDIDVTRTGIEFEIIGSGSISQTTLGRINSAAGGVTLELYADVDGPDVPSPAGDYIGTAATPIERPADIVRHFLTEYCGLDATAIDTTAFDDADTDLGTVAMATVLTDYGLDIPSILGAIAFQSRTNIVQAEGSSETVWKMYTAAWNGSTEAFEFDATPSDIIDWQEVAELGRSAEGVANQFRVLTAIDRSIDSGDETAFRQSTRANSIAVDASITRITAAKIDDSVERHGTRHHGGYFLPDIDSADLDQTAAYLIEMSLSEPSRFELRGVPWVDGYALERGDIVNFDLDYKVATVKARILEIAKSWETQTVDLVLVEVN